MTKPQQDSLARRRGPGGLLRKAVAALCLSLALGADAALAQTPTAETSQAAQALSLRALLPDDLSPWGMFLNANMIVKFVMIGLVAASLVSWTIWLAKSLELWSAKRAARRGFEALADAENLCGARQAFTAPHTPVALFISAAINEAERSTGLPADGVKERAVALLSRIEAQAGRSMTLGTGALATIGSTAPFVGLFGTVWGIMDSFIGISKSHTTNLAVVAPGIAEALLATAIGLVTAIPAVVFYNALARSITAYRGLLSDAANESLRHLSRDLDRDAAPSGHADAEVVDLRPSAE